MSLKRLFPYLYLLLDSEKHLETPSNVMLSCFNETGMIVYHFAFLS